MDHCPTGISRVLKNTRVAQAVQKGSDARRAKTEERGVYRNTLSDEVCSATQQMSLFQQPVSIVHCFNHVFAHYQQLCRRAAGTYAMEAGSAIGDSPLRLEKSAGVFVYGHSNMTNWS